MSFASALSPSQLSQKDSSFYLSFLSASLSSPCLKAPPGGSATLQRGSFLHLASLQKKPPHSQNADGSGEQGCLGGICSAHSCRSCHLAPHPCLSHHSLLCLAIAARALAGGGAFGVAWPWWCLLPCFEGREKATWAAGWPGREGNHLYLN